MQSSSPPTIACAALGQRGNTPDSHKRHTMSHPPPHIPGLEEPQGKDKGQGISTDEDKTPEKKDKVCGARGHGLLLY